jgi:hypothetical protein
MVHWWVLGHSQAQLWKAFDQLTNYVFKMAKERVNEMSFNTKYLFMRLLKENSTITPGRYH